MRLSSCGVGLLALVSFAISAAGPTKLEDFVKPAQFERVKISPTGEYLAVTTKRDDRGGLVILRLSDLKITGQLPSDEHETIQNFWWSGPDRIVASIGIDDGSLTSPQSTGELVGINADGSDHAYLFGYRGDSRSAAGRRTRDYGAAVMIDPRPEDPKSAIIAIYEFRGGEQQKARVYKLDPYTGQRVEMVSAPAPRARLPDRPKRIHPICRGG